MIENRKLLASSPTYKNGMEEEASTAASESSLRRFVRSSKERGHADKGR